ncbi:SusC/RagA family TonB-linked outer membrane protein [uncultured Bacteroides sp.]|uniref:SusC/RagA family TonB-linked outer membrane protein n=1 Tax=uncultured Bacteroides sp. TaxID=162156 RepID=UPI002AAC0514|nr:SusC/RagA family TonB-linked outer membrane protein [uncultured Bacteroides sp.]
MKISFVMLFFVVFQLQSATTYAQRTKSSITLSNASIEQVLNQIEENSDYVFLYNDKTINTHRIVSVNSKSGNIPEVLNEIFKGTNIAYTIVNKQIILSTKKANVVAQDPAYQIKGTVKDKDGETLIGVNIMIKGTSTGTTTDMDGHFSLRAKKGDVLSITYTGYTSKTVAVADTRTLDIVLEENRVELNEVVVTALGIKKEAKALSYNVQQVAASEIIGVKDANFMNSLAGKIAGVTINTSSSGIGGSARVVMRGTKSISGNNNALYVVDGIPLPSLQVNQPSDLYSGMGQSGDGVSTLNPDDIESMSVLSGAAAAALYGSDAANGVVMITTKKGEKNSFSVNISNSTSFYSPFVMPKFQNTYGSESGSYYSWGDKLSTPSSYDPKDFFQTGYNVNNSISLSTGSEKNQTYFSASSTTAEGIIHNNDLGKYNFSIRNSSSFLQDKLNLDLAAMYMDIKEQNMLSQGQYFNPLVPIYLFPRSEDIRKYQTFERYNVSRNFKTQYWPYGDLGLQMQNPYWITERDMFVNHKNRFLMSGALKYNINSWLNVIGRAKLDYSTAVNKKKYSASTSGLFADKYGAFYKDDIYTQQIYADAMMNINKYFGDISFVATLGTSIRDVVYDYSSLGGNLQSAANLFSINNLNMSQAKTSQDNYHDQTQAIFATAQVGFKGLVYLDLTARKDWTSALANTKSSSVPLYPSAGISTILTDLFPIKSKVLSFMKARFSYSEVGNAPQRYITIPTYSFASGYPKSITFFPNDGLEPERTKSYEVGLQTQLWGDKLKLDVSLYKTSTYNQLFNPTLSSTSGYTSFYVNAGQIDNKGIEASLNLKQELGPVLWNSNLVYSLNKNKIIKLLPSYTTPGGETISMNEMDMGGTGSCKTILKEGGAMGDLYVTTLKTDEHGYINVDYTSKAVKADPNTYVYAGNTNPLYNIGWRNSFEWKGLSLGFLISARVGGVGVSLTQAVMDAFGVSQATADARDNGGALVNGFRIPAQPYYQTIGGGTAGVGSMYVYSATNVRLAELTFGYDVPVSKLMSFVKSMNVSLIGRNLFMFYNKAPYDPELTASTGTYFQGIDYFMQPSLRNIGFSVKLRF